MKTVLIIYFLVIELALLCKADSKVFISGKGCGTLTPIRILDRISDETSNFECSIITLKDEAFKENQSQRCKGNIQNPIGITQPPPKEDVWRALQGSAKVVGQCFF